MAFAIRRPKLSDVEDVISLSKEISDRWYIENLDDWIHACEHQDNCRRYFVAINAKFPSIIGYACLRPDLPRQPDSGKFRLQVGVHPKWRNHGIGHALIDEISRELHEMKATALRVRVVNRNDLEFFKKMHFVEYERMLRLRADIENIDATCLNTLVTEQKMKGVTISTLEDELKHSSDCLENLFQLDKELYAIFPGSDPVVPLSFEAFVDSINRIKSIHNGFFIAKDGLKYIGCSYILNKETERYGLVQGLTGVLSNYQNRGIATTLKYCTIQYAKLNNFHYIETGSLSSNEKMLAVQRKVGFKVEESEFRLERKLNLPENNS